MIHIIAMVPYLDKIERGKVDENQHFHLQYTTYRLSNDGLQVGRYLNTLGVDYQAYGIVGKQALKFKEDDMHAIQMDVENGMRISFYQDEELWQRLYDPQPSLSEDQLMLYKTIVGSSIHQGDLLVFADMLDTLSFAQAKALYCDLRNKAKLSIWALPPMYLSMLKDAPCNVLVQDLQSLKKHFKIQKELNLVETIHLVKQELLSLSKIVILGVRSNKILIFVGEDIYSADYKVDDPKDNVYYAAMISGVLYCHIQNGDIKCLLEEVLSLSVGASLSGDLYIPEKEVIAKIKEKMVISKLV
ncbi:fructose-1-phosphate kinase PfkB-like protein [Breznakia sp. PF5-3]|uniref:hypothetical protein n=1 Tax=unclassified Breznakia TaxID=2623764 RepID=UPI002404A74F|nr:MULTISPECIES: hypothetical protein [unclassified Breznakia]MDF9824291.1 fructose-1-phosphate kinase PfkB-like protein [Breznakia sp. PM6-1]MDF9835515.1 fructose-1-phosphate kinase PfkB-like protein [Breznakia sp. PF5-3]